jgi:hypothetical protein
MTPTALYGGARQPALSRQSRKPADAALDEIRADLEHRGHGQHGSSYQHGARGSTPALSGSGFRESAASTSALRRTPDGTEELTHADPATDDGVRLDNIWTTTGPHNAKNAGLAGISRDGEKRDTGIETTPGGDLGSTRPDSLG